MEQYEINKFLESFNEKLNDLNKALKIEEISKEIDILNEKMLEPNFWDDQAESNKVITRLNLIKDNYNKYLELKSKKEDIDTLIELASEEEESLDDEIELSIKEFDKELSEFEVLVLLNGKYDNCNAIIEIHPGAGGTESMDWAEMLFRMYQRYAQKKGFKFETLDYLPGDEAGIKSVTFLVKGKNAYGYLKAERGVHRLVRISPFDSNARRHTSFASLDVAPEVNDSLSIEIKDEDIKVDVYRSSGAGGQSVNTTDSAVRITHLKTGIVVTCQNERSQIKNREVALNVLRGKLAELELRRQEEEMKKLKGEQMDIGFGSQIRSYVFHPYTLVKDHRTGFEIGNIQSVMDGEIDSFINSYLKSDLNKA